MQRREHQKVAEKNIHSTLERDCGLHQKGSRPEQEILERVRTVKGDPKKAQIVKRKVP